MLNIFGTYIDWKVCVSFYDYNKDDTWETSYSYNLFTNKMN